MVNLKCPSKSSTDWTPGDPLAYNIEIVYEDATTFFEVPNLPEPQVLDEVLTLQDATAAQHDDSYTLLRTLDLVMTTPPGEESAVNDFVVALFRVLGFTGRAVNRVSRTRKDLLFLVCGEERYAQTDVCIMDDHDILLVVQEEKQHLDPEPQLIAGAIAAFHQNNLTRLRALGSVPLASKVLLGITMHGTMPVFYKIPVTAALVQAIQLGQYPAQETVIHLHVPRVPRSARYSEGMRCLDARHAILSCFEAFKRFL